MTDLLDLMRPPMITHPVDLELGVTQCDPHETRRLVNSRMAWDSARIEIHQHTDGTWMWSTSFQTANRGSGYRVGPKWGQFAQSRHDALHWAITELLKRLESVGGTEAEQIRAWARKLT